MAQLVSLAVEEHRDQHDQVRESCTAQLMEDWAEVKGHYALNGLV